MPYTQEELGKALTKKRLCSRRTQPTLYRVVFMEEPELQAKRFQKTQFATVSHS